MEKIKIRDIEVYHGENIVDNSIYFEHFKKRGKDIKHFFEDVMKKDKRYLIDREKENSLTMAIEVSKKLLQKTRLKGSDIDMIVYSSQLPEYVAPPSAVLVHNAIEGKVDCFCYDLNSNCTGMTFSVEQMYRYMSMNKKVNKVLIVGSDFINLEASPDDEAAYGHYGDAACALILEKTNEENCRLVDSDFWTYSSMIDKIKFPKCGFSKLFEADREELYLKWDNPGCPWLDLSIKKLDEFLELNSITIDDISLVCASQYAYGNIEVIRKKFELDKIRVPYIGDVYGYTGTSSPFIALYESLKDGKVKRGDYILFWTFGAGAEGMTMLIQY